MLFGADIVGSIGNSQLGMVYKKTPAQVKNLELLEVFYNYWSNIAVSRYVWEGLPDSVDERLLNAGLYLQGNVAFFKHSTLGLIALPCNRGNRFNLFYQPTSVTAFGFGSSYQLSNEPNTSLPNFEMVRATPTGVPQAFSVMNIIVRMVDLLRSVDVIAQRMKRPFVILCDEKERLTIENMFKKLKDNEELILAMKNYGLTERSINIAPTPATGDITCLWESYKMYETMLYTMMGIDNKGYEKKERLLVDEVNANNMVIEMAEEVSLNELRLGIDRVNKQFGTNISVDMRNLYTYGGEEFGPIHYATQ